MTTTTTKLSQAQIDHDCADPDADRCCADCCEATSGGCICAHDCTALCIDSCPAWLAARRAERAHRRPPRRLPSLPATGQEG